MRDALLTLLRADSDLVALLPGGIYDAAIVGEISRQTTPTAFDANAELQPCLLVRIATRVPLPPLLHARQANISLLFYQRVGVDAIEAAVSRAYALLQDERLAGVRNWQWRWAGDTPDVREDVLDCRLIISRWSAPHTVEMLPEGLTQVLAMMRFGAHLSGVYAVNADAYATGLTAILTEAGEPILTENGIPIYVENN